MGRGEERGVPCLEPHGLPRTAVGVVRLPPPLRIGIEAVAHARSGR